MQQSEDVVFTPTPHFSVSPVQLLQQERHLHKLTGSHPVNFALDVVHRVLDSLMLHPLNVPIFELLIRHLSQGIQRAQKLTDREVLLVLEVKQDLIASHVLKINIVVDWTQLFVKERPAFGCVDLDHRFFD
jgi:hypothetical protein